MTARDPAWCWRSATGILSSKVSVILECLCDIRIVGEDKKWEFVVYVLYSTSSTKTICLSNFTIERQESEMWLQELCVLRHSSHLYES
jgi:hypothetical protein